MQKLGSSHTAEQQIYAEVWFSGLRKRESRSHDDFIRTELTDRALMRFSGTILSIQPAGTESTHTLNRLGVSSVV